jgi:hypothetical protein
MLYTARVSASAEGFVAECLEVEAAGRAPTRSGAIESLRQELFERMGHVEGMAPPKEAPSIVIDIVVVDDAAGASACTRPSPH